MATQHSFTGVYQVTLTTWETQTQVMVAVPYGQGETWQAEKRAIGLALRYLDSLGLSATLGLSSESDDSHVVAMEATLVKNITGQNAPQPTVKVVSLDSTYWAVAN